MGGTGSEAFFDEITVMISKDLLLWYNHWVFLHKIGTVTYIYHIFGYIKQTLGLTRKHFESVNLRQDIPHFVFSYYHFEIISSKNPKLLKDEAAEKKSRFCSELSQNVITSDKSQPTLKII